ncbi:hypothetical protein [Enterobacter asburiae]|uniref:hypothetical protein n=1 Tax=Enterobacter asburiae TaxID=61645 RepID=UPI0006494CCC|nr:hypothetical protein [Enterobacter asburiae]KLP59348.1 hypothetical protein ABF83_22790 [Enterobacter asburiae]KUQ27247.1 hypothetical protein AWI12_12275 [Enterobacter asburiae]
MSTITRERVANLLQFNSEGSDCQSNAEQWEVHELARIALASLEADAVAYVDPFAFHNFSVYRAGETDNKRMGREWMWANPDAGLIPVYTAPPAPVSVPAAMEMDDDFDSAFEHGKAVGWNACRAAMLQGADGNSPVIQDGWVMVPVEPTTEMQSAAAGAIRFDTTPINKLWTGNAVYRAMLAAAPQQEVKS